MRTLLARSEAPAPAPAPAPAECQLRSVAGLARDEESRAALIGAIAAQREAVDRAKLRLMDQDGSELLLEEYEQELEKLQRLALRL